MVAAVGIAISPAAGLAVADPTDPLIPVPTPTPVDTVPDMELPPVQEIPSVPPVVQSPEPPQEQPAPQPQVIEPVPPVTMPDSSPEPPVTDAPGEQPTVILTVPSEVPEVPSESEMPPVITESEPEIPTGQSVPDTTKAPSDESPSSQSTSEEPDISTSTEVPDMELPSSVPSDTESGTELVPESLLPGDDESVVNEPSLSEPDQQQVTIVQEPEPLAPDELRRLSELEKMPPIEAAVYDINGPQDHGYQQGDHDWNKGNKHDDSWDDKQWPRWPVPGRDKVDHNWDHRDRDHNGPPRNHGIKWQQDREGRPVIINYTQQVVYVNITNINVANNINTAAKVIPVYPGRPMYLGHDWCGGMSGTFGWSANFGVAANTTSARFAGGGAFTVSQGCGVHLPPQVYQQPYVKIVAPHHPRPVYARSVYYETCSCLVVNNNTFLYGKWQGKPYHSAFVPRSYRTDVVFQPQPIQGVPRWLFDTGVNPTNQASGLSDQMREWAPLLFILGGVLVATGGGVAYWCNRQPDGGGSA